MLGLLGIYKTGYAMGIEMGTRVEVTLQLLLSNIATWYHAALVPECRPTTMQNDSVYYIL